MNRATRFLLLSLVSCVGILALLIPPLFAQEVVIAQLGDSVGQSAVNRGTTDQTFQSSITWIGDNSTPQLTFARGGWTLQEMLEGRNTFGPELNGLVHHVVNPIYPAPDVVYILGGYNDAAQARSDKELATRFQNLVAMVDLIEATWNSKIFIANLTNFPADRMWSHRQQNVELYNELLDDFVVARPNTVLVDNNSVVTDDLVSSDGLHLTREGQVLIGEHFALSLIHI